MHLQLRSFPLVFFSCMLLFRPRLLTFALPELSCSDDTVSGVLGMGKSFVKDLRLLFSHEMSSVDCFRHSSINTGCSESTTTACTAVTALNHAEKTTLHLL